MDGIREDLEGSGMRDGVEEGRRVNREEGVNQWWEVL
jgi:hypothetical protein